MLHELEIPFESISVDLKTKQTQTGEDFLKINPKGPVPALQIDDQTLLTENIVIQQYLADIHKAFDLLPPVGDFKRYRVLEWFNFIATDLHKNSSPFFNAKMPDAIKEEIYRPILKAKLDFVEHHLSKNTYLMGDTFTLPDSYLFVILRWVKYFKMDLANWPSLSRYFSEMKQRKSVQKALAEEGF